jgi:aryl-alcohol dehydrogenase-like predicted oxidoreductase
MHMQYARLGNTGLVVSRLSLGSMTFTAGNKMFPTLFKVEARLASELVGVALDSGINFFDTADVYAGGEAETLLGAALKPRRSEAIITTKVGLRNGARLDEAGLSRRNILRCLDLSLSRLGTDHVDVYMVHCEDPFTPLEETLETLDLVVRSGKARYLGFSNWAAWRVSAALELQAANGWARFTHGQMYYSLLGRDIERDVIPMMQRYGLGLTVWSPLAMGFLSGKYTRENLKDPANRYSGVDMLPFDKEQGFKLVDSMRAIATAHKSTVAQVAIAWLLARKSVSSVIIGASNRKQLEDNLKSADVSLSAAEVAQLDAATPMAPVYPHWYNQAFLDQPISMALQSGSAGP